MSGGTVPTTTRAVESAAVRESRRQLTRDGLATSDYALPMGLVFRLAALQAMRAVTYPSRALPMLAPGIERMPAWAVWCLRLAGPAALAGLAAVNCLLTADKPPRLLIGIEPPAVAACVLVVARTRPLLCGVTAAVVVVAVVRAVGVAA